MTQYKTFDVFLSHNSIDKPWVILLKKALQGQGLKVWLDQDEIRPGDIFADALEVGLENSKAVALIVSPEAISSEWVKEEYYRALSLAHRKKEPLQLIPVILRDAEIPGFLANRSWVDFRDESRFHQNLEQLVWGISGEKPSETMLEHFKAAEPYVPFTNRQDELKLILSSSAPAYYLLDAPAGYGKSTLLGELRKQFSERKWTCAYLALDSSLEMDELAEAVAENLSILNLLPSPRMNQGAGYRLGSALQGYWNNSQEGLVLLFDLEPGPGNAEILERLLKEFIPEIEDSLQNISPFESGDNRFRVVIAGRYLHSYYSHLSLQVPSISPSLLYLTPFEYQVIQNSSINYLKNHRFIRTRQIAGHILYLTGGHPGCMAKVLQLYKKSGMAPDTFLDKLSDITWTEIVRPVVNSIATEFPTTFGVHKLMSNNVLRYMDYTALRKLVDILEISEVRDEFDLADKLTGAALLNRNNYLLHDDITCRLICLGLRNDRRDEFVRLCQSAQTICEERLRDTSTPTPDRWTIEYLFQFLQQHALLMSKPEQRRELHIHFLQELQKVLQWLVTGRRPREQEMYLLDSIDKDWEFMFTVNYYLRQDEYNDAPVKELKSEVNHFFSEVNRFL